MNVDSVKLIALSEESSTSAFMAAYIVCELEKSLVGSIVMIVLAVLIVASKEIFAPLESVSLRIMWSSTLASVISLSSVFLIASSNSIVILVFIPIPVWPFDGVIVTTGAVVSTVVKFKSVSFVIPA